MVNIGFDKLKKDIISEYELTISQTTIYCKVFKEVIEKNLLKTTSVNKNNGSIQKHGYLKAIQNLIRGFSNSKKCNLETKCFIDSKKYLNYMIFDSLIEMKVIEIKSKDIVFNQDEISNLSSSREELSGM